MHKHEEIEKEIENILYAENEDSSLEFHFERLNEIMQLLVKHEEEMVSNLPYDINGLDEECCYWCKATKHYFKDLTKNNQELESTHGELSNDYKVEGEKE